MERLIELLSRYGKDDDWCLVRIEGQVRKIDEMLIISKKYGFIKWLVDNDKIDYDKINRNDIEININRIEKSELLLNYCKLLMQLAIQDNPIEFLVSILK